MYKKLLATTAVFLVSAVFSFNANAGFLGLWGEDYDVLNAKAAKVTILEAIKRTSELHEGIVIQAELEEKDGGKLYYEIDLVQNDKEIEVWVDAITGQVSSAMED